MREIKIVLTADCHVQEAENEAYQNSVIEAEQMVRESTVKQKEKQHNSIRLEDPGKQRGIILRMPAKFSSSVRYNNTSMLDPELHMQAHAILGHTASSLEMTHQTRRAHNLVFVCINRPISMQFVAILNYQLTLRY